MRIFPALLALSLLVVSEFSPSPAMAQTLDLGRGEVPLNVPAEIDTANPAPLVVLLHGYGSSGAGQEDYMKFGELVDRYGFILINPDGTRESGGDNNRFWNASTACCNFMQSQVDDTAYVISLIDEVKSRFNVDDRRVYLIGHSNGGFMSYRIAYEHPDTIAAIASLAGAASTESLPAPTRSVHVLQIHGTSDTTISYEGSDINGNNYPGAIETVERWAAYNGCAVQGDTTAMLDLERNLDGMETTVVRYDDGCRTGGSSELWTIAGGSHVPAISDSFSEQIIEWLLARSGER
ncbi:MAG: alpha/beta fold hydrolase [Pseudohongiellaceae bacterium]